LYHHLLCVCISLLSPFCDDLGTAHRSLLDLLASAHGAFLCLASSVGERSHPISGCHRFDLDMEHPPHTFLLPEGEVAVG
jgi:hypothetical protein